MYTYEEVWYKCKKCQATLYGICEYGDDEDGEEWREEILVVCPKCQEKLHDALFWAFLEPVSEEVG